MNRWFSSKPMSKPNVNYWYLWNLMRILFIMKSFVMYLDDKVQTFFFFLCMLPFHFVSIVVVEGNIFLNIVITSINYICLHCCDLFV